MVLGIMLIFGGILIALYPPLLSLIIASLLILVGVLIIYISHHLKKVEHRFNDPFIDFFFRI